MPRRKDSAPLIETAKWTPAQLMAVKDMGPGVIGQEMYDAAQAYRKATGDGRFGPALLGSQAHNQAGPIAITNGVPVFAEQE